MKIQISYMINEAKEAAAVVAAIRSAIPGADPRHREKHPPRKHIYITIPEPNTKS